MKITQYIVLALSISTLSGCFENRKNTEQLCADNSQLKCDEFNMNDGQCRIPRTNLIWHRVEVLKSPTDINKIKEYQLTQEYKKCLEVASQIVPIEQAELKRKRYNALVNSGDNMTRLESELKELKTARSYYFLWSQAGDMDAKHRFLQLEGTKAVENSDLQYALATYYIDRDAEKTVNFLNHSIELAHSPDEIHTDAFASLASLYNQMKMKEKSYVWAKVSKAFGTAIASDQQLYLLYGFDEDKKEQLDDLAEEVIDAINDSKFTSSLIANRLN